MYYRNRDIFAGLLVEDMIVEIPDQVNDSAVAFMKQGSNKLGRWLRYQSFVWQRKASLDFKNSAHYWGILLHIRTLLILIGEEKEIKIVEPKRKEEPKVDPLIGVSEFHSGIKELKERKSKKE